MQASQLPLRTQPFSAAPTTAAYYPAHSLDQARRQLQRCIERAEGLGMVVGGAGMGKTLLLALLAEQFNGQYHVAHLAGTAIGSRRSLLQSIMFELGLPYRGLEEGELRLALIDHLQPGREYPNGLLLLVDEAHSLPLRLLEEIRVLTNLVRDGLPRVRLVLAGLAGLDERLANPKLDSFNQRIAARLYLESFSSQETAEYVRHELSRCGGDPAKFVRDDALRAIHVATGGIPRLINQLCDHALVLSQSLPLTAASIQQAWSDLQRLPGPWNEPTVAAAEIEFGSLEETSSPVKAGIPALESRLQPAPVQMQVEPPVPSTEELFGTGFDEELVLDRYSTLDVSQIKNLPQVRSAEGELFAHEVAVPVIEERRPLKILDVAAEEPAILELPVRKAGPLADQVAAALSHSEQRAAAIHDLDPALDPVYPEVELEEPQSAVRIAMIDTAEASPAAPHAPLSRPSSRFSNLFASLRGKK